MRIWSIIKDFVYLKGTTVYVYLFQHTTQMGDGAVAVDVKVKVAHDVARGVSKVGVDISLFF